MTPRHILLLPCFLLTLLPHLACVTRDPTTPTRSTAAQIVLFEIETMPPMRVIGKATYPAIDPKTPSHIPDFWQKCFDDGALDTLLGTPGRLRPDYVGFMCSGPDNRTYTYIVGMLFAPDTPVPKGFIYRDVPATQAGHARIRGPEKDIYPVTDKLTFEALKHVGYTLNPETPYCIELFNNPRFTTPNRHNEVILDYYMACKGKG